MDQVSDISNIGLLVADHIPAMLAYWDNEQICRFANNAYQDWFGKSREEMVNKITLKELLGPIYEKNQPFIQAVLEGKIQQFEREIRTPNGLLRQSVAHYYPDINKNEVRGFFVYVADITENKKLEKEISSSENKFKSLLESAPEAIVIVNKDGIIELVNAQTEKLFCYPRNELVGKKIETLIPARFGNKHIKQRSDYFSNPVVWPMGADLELFGLCKNGNEVPVEISISPIHLEDGNYVSAAIRDITARKEQEKIISEMATIIASSSDAIISKTLDGRILTWNKGAEKILGYAYAEIKGKHISVLFPQQLLQEEELLMSKVLKGENVEQYETVRLKKDKSKIDVSITLSAIKDKNGQIVGVSCILRDITLHKKAEKETQALLEITIRQYERLKNFAYIVSHNLRSHSGNIGILLDMYIKKTPGASENKILEHVKTASDSLNETIRNLNEVVLMNAEVIQCLEPINLYSAIEIAINSINQLIVDAGVEIINKLNEQFNIMGLPAYIDSILLNIITNGIKYRSPDRKGVIKLSAELQNNYVVLSIEDNGIGIDLKKHGNKLFGMYQTFHGNKDARGIGLFITKNQIEAIGAKVEVESRVDFGTTFKIYFKHE